MVKYFGWEGHVGVMYVGKLVEYGRTPQIIGRPLHPYAKALAAAIPEADPDLTRSKSKLQLRSLDIPNLAALPQRLRLPPSLSLLRGRSLRRDRAAH